MSMDSIEKYFKKNALNGTIGHAYLFSNVRYDLVKEKLESIIKEYIFENKIDLINNPDFYLIEPEKGIIKKEKIIELEQELIKTSQSNAKKLYVISECDKFNSSSANSLLKTLEEPSPNVYAFLITDNIENVFPTIKSRCQILYCDKVLGNDYEEEAFDKVISFIEKLENDNNSIVYDSKYFYKNFEKEELKKILGLVEYFYKDCINFLNDIELEYFIDYKDKISDIIEKNKEDKIIKKIIIINKNLNLLELNLNLNIFIDKLLIELRRL